MQIKAAETASFDNFPEGDPQNQEQQRPEGMDFKPFPRLKERDVYKRLGVPRTASFEEVVDARSYLDEQYKWHEPSRESIELAYDQIIKEKMQARQKFGFKPPRTGRRKDAIGEPDQPSLADRFASLFDPTITLITLINEGALFGALAFWALFSGDQSFPLAAAFGYSVYSFQSKRIKRDPEGPFFGGNAMVGAILSTLIALAVGCGVMALATATLGSALGTNTRQIGGCIVCAVIGLFNVYLK